MKVKLNSIVQIAKPLDDENGETRYRVIDLDDDFAKCQALDTGLAFPPVSEIEISDLKVVE